MTEPRVTWASYGKRRGWAHWGEQSALRLTVPGDEWMTKAVRVAAAAEGGKLDAVQCYDAGVMSAGPLQGTAAWGYLQRLIGRMQAHDFERVTDHLGEILYERSWSAIWEAPVGAFTRGGYAFYSLDHETDRQDPNDTRPELCRILLGGSDGVTWNKEQSDHAKAWVRGLVGLLRDPTFAPVVADECAWILRRFLWSKAVPYLERVESVPGILRAAYLAFAINHPAGALRLLKGTVALLYDEPLERAPDPTPDGTVAAMLVAAQGRQYRTPNTFPARAKAIHKALGREFDFWAPT